MNCKQAIDALYFFCDCLNKKHLLTKCFISGLGVFVKLLMTFYVFVFEWLIFEREKEKKEILKLQITFISCMTYS